MSPSVQNLLFASCLNLCSLSLFPNCAVLSYDQQQGSSGYHTCINFYHHFLLIWWLNLFLCGLSFVLSFDHYHAVVRSLIIFILTIWEFTIIQPHDHHSTADNFLMYLLVFFLRPIVFGLFIVDILLDYDFRLCASIAYKQLFDEFIFSFINFLEGGLDIMDNLPWMDNFIEILENLTKLVFFANF